MAASLVNDILHRFISAQNDHHHNNIKLLPFNCQHRLRVIHSSVKFYADVVFMLHCLCTILLALVLKGAAEKLPSTNTVPRQHGYHDAESHIQFSCLIQISSTHIFDLLIDLIENLNWNLSLYAAKVHSPPNIKSIIGNKWNIYMNQLLVKETFTMEANSQVTLV